MATLCGALNHNLRQHNTYTHRYFYQRISDLPKYRDLLSAYASGLLVPDRMTAQTLRLPIDLALSTQDVQRLVSAIAKPTL